MEGNGGIERDITRQTILFLDITSFEATQLESAKKQDTADCLPQLFF
jgi:hypothetical protein